MNELNNTTNKHNTMKYYKDIETDILKWIFKKEEYLTAKFDVNDLLIRMKDRIIVGEFKYRRMPHTRFKDEWVLEELKYKNLVNKAQRFSKPYLILYINYFEDGTLIIWNLNKIITEEREVYEGMFNTCTAIELDGSGVKKNKNVYHLRNDEAMFLKHNLNITNNN